MTASTRSTDRVQDTVDQAFHAPIHVLRAIAIVAIVAAHTWSFPITFGEGEDPGRDVWVLWAATETLFHDSTLLFTLISGLLFTLVLRGRSWQRFFTGKILTVALPYVAMSLLYALAPYRPFEGFQPADFGDDGFFSTLVRDLLTGGAAIHLWYIPVLGVLFALTPALIRLVESDRYRPVGALLIVAPLFLSRHFPEVRPGTVFYFLGAYLAGMYIGAHYGQAIDLLRRRTPLLAVVAALTSVMAFAMLMNDIHWVGPISVRESTLYVQKLALAGLLLVAVQRFHSRDTIPGAVDAVAENSFAIYFLHIYPIAVMTHWGLELFDTPHGGLLLAILGLIQLVVSLPILLWASYLGQGLFGRWSRSIIGA